MLNFRREINPHRLIELNELFGMGSFGSVYSATMLETPVNEKRVAVKVIAYNPDELHQLGRELYFLKTLDSPFIVRYIDSILSVNELWVVMELCDAGSLLDIYQASQRTLDEASVKAVVACSILGLVHIHEKRSIHRDIKAGNILLSSSGKTLLSDFGVSTQLTDDSRRKTVIGTPYWMAPEILQEISYGENADIWSLGITIIETVEGQPPLYGVKPLRAMFMISSKPSPSLKESEKFSSDMRNFLTQCLQKNPYIRPQSKDLMTHAWISKEVEQLSADPIAGLQVLRDLVASSWKSICNMRLTIQQAVSVTSETAVSPRIPPKEYLDDGAKTIKKNLVPVRYSRQSVRYSRHAGRQPSQIFAATDNIKPVLNLHSHDGELTETGTALAGRAPLQLSSVTGDDEDFTECEDRLGSFITSSVVRVMIPQPMSPFITDSTSYNNSSPTTVNDNSTVSNASGNNTVNNSPRPNSHRNSLNVSMAPDLRALTETHLTPGQLKERSREVFSDEDRERDGSFVRQGSIFRRPSGIGNANYCINKDLESALRYFRNEKEQNILLQSNKGFFADMMKADEIAEKLSPDYSAKSSVATRAQLLKYDHSTMTGLIQEEYLRELEILEMEYKEDLRHLEESYNHRKQELFITYEQKYNENSA